MRTYTTQMKIIDAFTFYNEIDMLYYRLSTLNEYVDHFILVEASLTHSGIEKPSYFNIHREKFAGFQHKIIHIVDYDLEPTPVVHPDEIHSYTNKYWKNENHQRNSIDQGIKQLDLYPDDIIIISDCDEIPNREILKQIKNQNSMGDLQFCSFMQDFYYYNLTCKVNEIWTFSKIITYQYYKTVLGSSPQTTRMSAPLGYIKNGGWHLSYFGDSSFIKNKIQNFSHQEFNQEKYTDLKFIETSIQNKKSIYNRPCDDIIFIPIHQNDNLPFDYEIYLSGFIE